MGWLSHRNVLRRASLTASLALVVVTLASVALVSGEGSGTIYRGVDPVRFRSALEWRTTSYGGGDSPEFVLRRRTLLKVFALEGETILLGSSGIGVGGAVDFGNIRVLNPGQVRGSIGQETIPDLAGSPATPQPGAFANGFSCLAQRAATGNTALGRIASIAQEQAGPLPAAGGYTPCTYVAPTTGIYDVVMSGPSGENSNDEPEISGTLNAPPADFGVRQRTAVTAWDVTVRDPGGNTRTGRLFAYYYAGNTGSGGRQIAGEAFVVTTTGFRYRVFFTGDPFGFIFYVNQLGFQNADGTPLYRNLMADATAPAQTQNELRELQGGVRLLPPAYPLFISRPDPLVLGALGIPTTPEAPAISGLRFTGPGGDNETAVNVGGIFSFTSTRPGVYYVVVSRDGSNFDPTEPRNRVLRGVAPTPGLVTVSWDGRDNAGTPFPPGDFLAGAAIQGGEVHFPFLDVENNLPGGPEIELINPPDITGDGVGDCPPWNGGCFGAFYDDRGYRSANGTLVGTAVNGNLCPGDAANPRGFGNPPLIAASDQVLGFDSRTDQRAFGFAFDANPSSICLPNGGFGDKKGLDLWTYYPSNVLTTPLRIVEAAAVTLTGFTATRVGDDVALRWETGLEIGSVGFHVLRSATGALGDAVRVTPALIPARGGSAGGAAYRWLDAGAATVDASYWLQELEVDGTIRHYGPVRQTTGLTRSPNQVHLPLVRGK